MMEHQNPPAQPVRPNLERAAVARERVRPAIPCRCILGSWIRQVMLAIVEHKLEAPIGGLSDRRRRFGIGEIRSTVSVVDILDISLRRTAKIATVAFIRGGLVDAGGILRFVAVKGSVAAVVVTFADQPTEYPAGIRWVGDPALGRLAVPTGYVVFRDGAPERVLRVRGIEPALDAGEEPLHAGPV